MLFLNSLSLQVKLLLRYLTGLGGLAAALVLTGCSIPSPKQQVLLENTSAVVVEAHQQHLHSIYRWQLSARLAITQKQPNERDGLYLDWRWQRQPEAQQQLRFSHPLKGQLASLTLSPAGAELIIDGERYQDRSADRLLQRVLGAPLPVIQLSDWVIGKTTPALTHQRFISGGRIAEARVTRAGGALWQINWYYADAESLLPQQIHLESNQLRIKMQLNQWQVTPALPVEPLAEDLTR